MITIKVPGDPDTYQFPDDTPDETITKVMQARFGAPGPGLEESLANIQQAGGTMPPPTGQEMGLATIMALPGQVTRRAISPVLQAIGALSPEQAAETKKTGFIRGEVGPNEPPGLLPQEALALGVPIPEYEKSELWPGPTEDKYGPIVRAESRGQIANIVTDPLTYAGTGIVKGILGKMFPGLKTLGVAPKSWAPAKAELAWAVEHKVAPPKFEPEKGLAFHKTEESAWPGLYEARGAGTESKGLPYEPPFTPARKIDLAGEPQIQPQAAELAPTIPSVGWVPERPAPRPAGPAPETLGYPPKGKYKFQGEEAVPEVEGIKYNGIQELPEGPPFYVFTDDVTHSTFMTRDLSPEALAAHRDAMRAKFAAAERPQATPAPETKLGLGESGEAEVFAGEGGGMPPSNFSKLKQDDTVTLYRGASNKIYGEGGPQDIRLSRWTPDIETATRNAHGGTVYRVTVPAKDVLPMQELFDPKVAGAVPGALEKGRALASKYGESAFPELSASFDESLGWERQGLLRGKHDIELLADEPAGWGQRTIPHVASYSKNLQSIAAVRDTTTGKIYTGASHSTVLNENAKILNPVVDAGKAEAGWEVGGKFYTSQHEAAAALYKLQDQSGIVRPGLVSHVANVGVGAATGAVVDKDNPLRGAAIGGILGGTGGWLIQRALFNKVLAGKAWPKGIAKVGDKIEMPPVHDLKWKEPTLAINPETQMGEAAVEGMLAKGVKRDTNMLMSQQIIKEAIESPENYQQILNAYGKTTLDFVKDMGESASSWGRSLGELGNLAKRLMIEGGPEVKEALTKLGHAAPTAADHLQYWWRRVDNIRRGLLVTQLSTAIRNAAVQSGRVGLNVVDTAMQGVAQKLWKAGGGRVVEEVSPLDGLNMVLRLGQKNKATVDKILSNFPSQTDRLTATYMSDVMSTGGAGGKIIKGADTAVNVANAANRFQEFTVRRAVFMGRLEHRLKSQGTNIETALSSGLKNVKLDDARYAVDEALDFTFSQNPKYGSAGQKIVSVINAIPGATFIVPFPRFMMNSFKFLYEFSPLGLLKLTSGAERSAMAAGNMKVISRATVGCGLFGAAYAIRASQPEHSKWNEYVKENGEVVDMKPYNPLAAYLFAADVVHKYVNGSLWTLTGKDLLEGISGTNFRAGVGLYTVDAFLSGITNFASELKMENQGRALKEFSGEVVAGFLTPLKQLRDAMSGYETFAKGEGVFGNVQAPNKREEPFMGPIKANLPFTEARPGYSPTQQGPRMNVAPVAKQLTGLATSVPKGPSQMELDRLGFTYQEVLPSSGLKEFDNLVAKEMQLDIQHYLDKLVQSPGYAKMNDAERGEFFGEEIKEIRQDARESVLDDRPDLEDKLKVMRTPKRKLLVENELRRQEVEP